MTKQIVGVVGSGMVGRDPFDPQCWSGSSANFFNECKTQGVLRKAIGVEADKLSYYLFLARNFNMDKSIWRAKFYLDPGYYRALTNRIAALLTPLDKDQILLQIGGHYNTPIASPGSVCCSYHDGNVVQMMKSPYFNNSLLPYAQRAAAYEQKVYDGLNKIFTMSEYLKRSFVNDFNQPESKVVCIGAGVNVPAPDSFIEKDYSTLDILFMGVDFQRKGGSIIVKAFNNIKGKHKNARLKIVGPKQIPDILKTESSSQIDYVGFLSRTDLSQRNELLDLLKNCHLSVLPTRYEPFGLGAVECMMYGMPALATDGWALPEMITPGKTGELLEVDNVGQLSDLLDQYLCDPARIYEQGKAAYESVINKYTWKTVVENLKRECELLSS